MPHADGPVVRRGGDPPAVCAERNGEHRRGMARAQHFFFTRAVLGEQWLYIKAIDISGTIYMQGHNYAGHSYIGHNYTGHNYTDNNYISHNYTGHNYIGYNNIVA